MLPTQILLNNFPHDLLRTSIPGDNVDPALLPYMSTGSLLGFIPPPLWLFAAIALLAATYPLHSH
jgi:hypothetical protein